MKTIVGIALVKPTTFETALFRIETFRKEDFDDESLKAFVKYVAKTSRLSYFDLVDKLRLNFID